MIRALILASVFVLLAADPAPQWFGLDEAWEPGRIRIRGNLWQIAPASAHPGRTDRDNCHEVRTEFTYRSGKVAPVGERHCHRPLDRGLSLDGRETLQDPPASPPALTLEELERLQPVPMPLMPPERRTP